MEENRNRGIIRLKKRRRDGLKEMRLCFFLQRNYKSI